MFVPNDKRMKVAEEISNKFDANLPVLTKFLTATIDQANKVGYLRGVLGRLRWFKKGTAWGNAANFPIQNANAEAMKMALIRLDKYIEANAGLDARLVLNVHDEVVVEVREDQAEELAPVVKNQVAQALELVLDNLPGGASVKYGDHWEK